MIAEGNCWNVVTSERNENTADLLNTADAAELNT